MDLNVSEWHRFDRIIDVLAAVSYQNGIVSIE